MLLFRLLSRYKMNHHLISVTLGSQTSKLKQPVTLYTSFINQVKDERIKEVDLNQFILFLLPRVNTHP